MVVLCFVHPLMVMKKLNFFVPDSLLICITLSASEIMITAFAGKGRCLKGFGTGSGP